MATTSTGLVANGTVIAGKYQLRDLIGAGGYGAVYRARQLGVDRDVAVKLIRQHLAADDRVVKRFLREAKVVSRLKNPHIVPVHDFGYTDDGLLYLVMELVEGKTLKRIFAEEAPIEPGRLTWLLSQVCEALAEAHDYTPSGSD